MYNLKPHRIATQFVDPTQEHLSLARQGELLGISRSSLYYTPVPINPETLDLMIRIDKIHTDWPTYGARTIAAQLRRDTGLVIGRKRTGTLMENMGIQAVYQKPRLSLNTTEHPVFPYLLKGVSASYPNHIWGTDITYIRLKGGFVYLSAYIDWYSRYVVGWELSTTLETSFVLEAARQALTVGIPEIINSDQGVQFTDSKYIDLWESERTKVSMDHRGRCFDNIFTERFWRTLKYDEVYLKDYLTVREAETNIGDFIHRYNTIRLHESLGYRTPAEVYFVN
jgi:putative transposase